MVAVSLVMPFANALIAFALFRLRKTRTFLVMALIFLGLALFESSRTLVLWRGQRFFGAVPPVEFLKAAGYVFVFFGLLMSLIKLLNQSEERMQNLTLASEEVEEEIQERKWTETLLQESRVYAESIVETIREPLLILDSTLTILKANRSFYQTFKLNPEKTVGRLFHKLSKGRWNNATLIAQLKAIIPEDNYFEDFEITQVFPHIGLKSMLLTARPIYQKEACSNLILLSMEDITERKAAQEEVKRLVRGIESTAESIIITDADGTIRYVNPAFTELTGYSTNEVMGQKPNFLSDEAHSREVYEQMWQTMLDGGVWSGELTNRNKNGGVHEVNLTISPIVDDNHEVEGFVAVQNDITAIKRTEQELERRADELARSNAELEQFAYIASHDLQQPLRMVSSYCQLLQRRYADKLDADACEFINYAVDGAKQMQQLINDLLSYSRVGTRPASFETVDINVVIQHVLNHLRMAIEESDAEITCGNLPKV
ncbi:MAG: PAS domain S-box protein, partial [bacterium]